jgi:cyanophycin synthetase
LTRSWKQVIKFKAEGGVVAAPPAVAARPAVAADSEPAEEALAMAVHDDATLQAAGFVRDERGLRFVDEPGD